MIHKLALTALTAVAALAVGYTYGWMRGATKTPTDREWQR